MRPLKGWLLASFVAATFSGCGDDGGSSGTRSRSPSGTFEEDPELNETGLHASGGPAMGASNEGLGGPGGEIRARAELTIRLASSEPAPAAPALPNPPASGTTLGDAELAQDVVVSGHILIPGTVTVSGPGSVRSITAVGGDIVVSGTLRSGSSRGIALHAPNGTVHVTGVLSTAGTDASASGESGGPITIDGGRISISGEVVSAGENHPSGPGGSGGAVELRSTSGPILLSGGAIRASGGSGTAGGGDGGPVSVDSAAALQMKGEIHTRGGTAQGTGADLRAGRGGRLSLQSDAALEMAGTCRIRGGRARSTSGGAQGGRGGDFIVEGRASARLYGTVDARGGSATASSAGSGLEAGAGGSILIGQSTAMATLATGPGTLSSAGGSGGAAGGDGGPVSFYTSSGDLDFAGTVDGSGGDSELDPGHGAIITALCDGGGGSIFSAATLRARGGSATGGAVFAPGGAGGRIDLVTASATGAIATGSASLLDVDGGDAGGGATAGAGGEVRMNIPDATVSVSGKIQARGGSAPAGTGGRGGLFWVVSDDNANSMGGDITLESGSVFDLSGGSGAVGGHARHDDTGSATTDPATTSVVLDSESGLTRNMGGIIRNDGMIIARGGANNGWGGDVSFHGRGHDLNRDPVEGNQDRAGHGSGQSGHYLSD